MGRSTTKVGLVDMLVGRSTTKVGLVNVLINKGGSGSDVNVG